MSRPISVTWNLRADGCRSRLTFLGPTLRPWARGYAQGAEAIYQATFIDKKWGGRADFVVRVAIPSDLGAWSYEAIETKLARSSKSRALIQLCLYSAQLGWSCRSILLFPIQGPLGSGKTYTAAQMILALLESGGLESQRTANAFCRYLEMAQVV